MKKLLFLFLFLGAGLAATAQEAGRTAVLVTHYGSSDEQTRALTLDALTRDARQRFAGAEVREAYISPIVRRRLAARGVHKDSPTNALMRLRAEGFRRVFVLSTTLIEGGEMASVRDDAARMAPFFDRIEVGNPLLYSVADCQRVVDILTRGEQPGRGEAVVFVGHGNQLPSTATYAMLDYMMRAAGHDRFHVSTIEGYPTLESTVAQLRRERVRRVTLVPLLLVCGNHTKEDIAGTWREELERQGFEVTVRMQGLGENADIRALYLDDVVLDD